MDNWKIDFYKNYPTNNNQKVDQSYFYKYIPYGKYILNKLNLSNKGAKILDLGCGLGGFIKYFHDQGYKEVIGVDASMENITIAKTHGIDFIQHGDVFTFLSQNKEKFDVVLALDIIEHFNAEDTIIFLKAVKQSLREGGKLVIHTANAEGIFGNKIRYADITHEQAFTQNTLSQLGIYTGYRNIECYEDKPQIYSITSAIRRVLWQVLTLKYRLVHAAECGTFKVILSQNFLTILTN